MTALRFVLHRIAAKLEKQDLFGLRGAKLRGLAVDGLILNRFNLTGVQFAGASLKRAQFRNAELPRANFDRACLIGADFHGATVTKATFRGARMTEADVTRAPLTEAQRRQIDVVRP